MSESFREVRKEVLEALQQAHKRDYETAVKILYAGIESGSAEGEELAVLYSTLAMIQKKQGKLDQAWTTYQLAEQAAPDDPVLKVITARFLLNERRQYDQAIKRARLILKEAKDVPSLSHQAYTIIGLAYFRKGQQKKALEMLETAMSNNFSGMVSAENIDFNLVEALVREQTALAQCQAYLRAACNLARQQREYKALTVFQKVLDSFEQKTA